MKKRTREQWLADFGKGAAGAFEKQGKAVPPMRIGVGLLQSKKNLAVTYAPALASDGAVEITVTPERDTTAFAAGAVTHEMIHAVGITNHRRDFAVLGAALGLVGKPTHMTFHDDSEVPEWARKIIDRIGPYPSGTLSRPPGGKKQTTRMIKVECKECGLIWRASKTALAGKEITCPDSECRHEVDIGS